MQKAVLDRVAAGKLAIGYNIIGSYALESMSRHTDLALVLPKDYTLVMSRIAAIPARAPHPDAARLFLDYLLSRSGQQYLAKEDMPSVRSDVERPAGLEGASVPMRAIRVSPALLVDRDQLTRRYFLKRWNQAMEEPIDQSGALAAE